MAPFLRVSFHGLRCSRLVPSSLSSPRELLKPPESSYILRRWYGESAALEETCRSTQPVNDKAGECKAVSQGENSAKPVDKTLKESTAATAAAEEPSSAFSTDKLSSLIMGKIRSKNSSNGSKDNGVLSQTEFTASMTNKLPEGGSQQIGEDKWDQVMNSMRNIVAKKKQNPASFGATPNLVKSRQDENQDDFADLDLPQAQDEGLLPSKVAVRDGFLSATDALRNFTPNLKPKEAQMQGLNGKQKDNGFQGYQQKAKEAKPTSFSFLKSLDATASNSGVAEGQKYTEFRGLIDSQVKPKKTSDAREFPQESSHEAKSISSANTVCIRNLPSQINLSLVKEALSLHGEVISSFKTPNSDGSCNAFVEFKMAEAMDGVLASRWLNLDSKAFSIVRADAPITTVVRLSRVNADTTDSQVSSICEKFGSLDHIKRRGNGVYDVYYKANELSNMSTILDSLNEVTLNQRRLVATPAPLLLPALRREMLKGIQGQAWHASQLSQTLSKIEKGLESVAMCFEDLKSLTAMEDEFTKPV